MVSQQASGRRRHEERRTAPSGERAGRRSPVEPHARCLSWRAAFCCPAFLTRRRPRFRDGRPSFAVGSTRRRAPPTGPSRVIVAVPRLPGPPPPPLTATLARGRTADDAARPPSSIRAAEMPPLPFRPLCDPLPAIGFRNRPRRLATTRLDLGVTSAARCSRSTLRASGLVCDFRRASDLGLRMTGLDARPSPSSWPLPDIRTVVSGGLAATTIDRPSILQATGRTLARQGIERSLSPYN